MIRPFSVIVSVLLLSLLIVAILQTDSSAKKKELRAGGSSGGLFVQQVQEEHPNNDVQVHVPPITEKELLKYPNTIDEKDSSRHLATVPSTVIWNNDYRNGYYWITVRIGYWFSYQSKTLIKSSLRDLETRSKVIKFDFVNGNPGKPYIHLLNNHQRKGCWSRLGKTSESYETNGQPIVLSEQHCMNSATIQHEMMHALAFGHEHSRPDRDNYVRIMWNNINRNSYNEFKKLSFIDSLGTPYDLDSIMHYQPYDHSINGKPTIVSKSSKSIGKRTTASPTDILQIQLMYQCISGTRHFDYFRRFPCTANCQCWENQRGCNGNNSWCKGNLVCSSNVCKPPGAVTNPGNGGSKQRKQVFKDQSNRINNGGRYFLVPGVMFDIQAKYSPIYVTNLIFNGLGQPSTAERVQVEIYTKQWTHRKWYSSPNKWTLVGSVTLNDNGSTDEQLFPSNSFAPIFIDSWNRQGFYIRVKNCSNNNCDKLRAWQGSNYSESKVPYAQDGKARILNGCILSGKFDNGWRTCKDGTGGTSYSFWGGFEYSLA